MTGTVGALSEGPTIAPFDQSGSPASDGWSLWRGGHQVGVLAGYLGHCRTISVRMSARLSKSFSLTGTFPQ